MSQKKRKSFNDVARILDVSDFEWLSDDMTIIPSHQPTSAIGERRSSSAEISAYRNVRLSAEYMIRGGEDTPEDMLQEVSRLILNRK